MPYQSTSDVPSYVPSAKRKQWLEVFNSAYARAKQQGMDDKHAEDHAFAEANGVAGPHAKFQKFVRFTKVHEAKREVAGIVTSEAVDGDGEICDYATTKPYYQKWSAQIAKGSQGKSLGNVREMHQAWAVGKVVELDFDDDAKQITVRAKIVDDDAWTKCAEGVYTGFSHGGRYVATSDDSDSVLEDDGAHLRYTAEPVEISVVDNPCNPEATFEYVKANGSVELRKFQGAKAMAKDNDAVSKGDAKTRRVGGQDLPASAFAYVGDPEDPSTWKLPIHDASHVRNAMAGFNQTQGIPSDKRAAVARRIIAAAEKHGIDASGFKEEYGKMRLAQFAVDFAEGYQALGGENPAILAIGDKYRKVLDQSLEKGMWDVSVLARVLCDIRSLQQCAVAERDYEQDESTQPEHLQQWLEDGVQILEEMVSEEGAELTGKAGHSNEGALAMSQATNAGELEKAGKNLHKSHHLFKAKHHEKMAKAFEHHPEVAKLHKDAADHHRQMAEAMDGQDGDEGKDGKEKAAAAGEPSELEKRAASDPVAKAVVEMKAMFEDLGNAFVKQNEALQTLLAQPQERRTAANDNVTVTKEGDNGGAAKGAGGERANDKAASTVDLIKQSHQQPQVVHPGFRS